METVLKAYLQVSATIFKKLTDVPKSEERDEYIEEISSLLETRGAYVEQLKALGFKYDVENTTHVTLYELDKGIQERLKQVLEIIKDDFKNLYNAKRNEIHYIDPYDNLRNLESRYFDSKK
jgi:flagellar protein FliT